MNWKDIIMIILIILLSSILFMFIGGIIYIYNIFMGGLTYVLRAYIIFAIISEILLIGYIIKVGKEEENED